MPKNEWQTVPERLSARSNLQSTPESPPLVTPNVFQSLGNGEDFDMDTGIPVSALSMFQIDKMPPASAPVSGSEPLPIHIEALVARIIDANNATEANMKSQVESIASSMETFNSTIDEFNNAF